MIRLIKNTPELVKLMQSVGQQGESSGRPRPLTPVECAYGIQRLMDEEGDSLAKVSERLNLGKPKSADLYKKRDTAQVISFLNLLKVPEESRNLAGWSTDGFPKIPFSLVSQLASFKPDEQNLILQSVFNTDNKKTMGKEDVKKIRKWRNENTDLSIAVCLEKVLKLKPVETINHIVVCEVGEKLKKFIASNEDHQKKLLEILQNDLDGAFYKIDATDILISISMDATAYEEFDEHQHKKGISFTKFLNDFLEDKIG